jgi:hypothetical protein
MRLSRGSRMDNGTFRPDGIGFNVSSDRFSADDPAEAESSPDVEDPATSRTIFEGAGWVIPYVDLDDDAPQNEIPGRNPGGLLPLS